MFSVHISENTVRCALLTRAHYLLVFYTTNNEQIATNTIRTGQEPHNWSRVINYLTYKGDVKIVYSVIYRQTNTSANKIH